MSSEKVIVGFSGGADSAAAALYLKEKGYDVTAVTLDFLGDTKLIERAASVADRLKIPHVVTTHRQTFEKEVIRYFIDGYLKGETPNPCVHCDTQMKFPLLEAAADTLGAQWIATGHYVKLKHEKGRVHLYQSQSVRKDQSYYLYQLKQTLLQRLIFPLAEFTDKKAVRAYLQAHQVDIPPEEESQGICFIKAKGYARFLKEQLPVMPRGLFKNVDDLVLGQHNGFYQFTLGQKKGLPKELSGQYVIGICPDENTVTVGDERELYRKRIFLKDVHLMEAVLEDKRFSFKVCRWGIWHTGCLTLTSPDTAILYDFDQPVRAPMPGQSAVFYDGERLIGGGIIQG